jgi:hypothetical protein
MYLARTEDGSVVPIGPPSADPSWRLTIAPIPGGLDGTLDYRIPFSPSGRRIAFTDQGPGQDGTTTVQVIVLDLVTGRRTQVTRLPSTPSPAFVRPTGYLSFVDENSVLFFTYTNPDGSNPGHEIRPFTVRSDGTGLRAVREPATIPGSRVVPVFSVTGPGASAVDLHVQGTPVNLQPGADVAQLNQITEVFHLDGRNLLQLTNYGRWDTGVEFLGRDGSRVFFHSSANPLGTNPSQNCQLFSIDQLGARLRQVTHFAQGPSSQHGCLFGPPPGCDVRSASQDQRTGTIVFDSSCDPLGTNAYGDQLFGMRADGSGLVQLTHAKGREIGADGTVSVELAAQFGYSASSSATFAK